MAAPVLTIAAVNQTDFVFGKNIRLGRNTLDVTLIDPVTLPALGDAVTSTNPTWAGTVVNVSSTDMDHSGHKWVTLTCTNSDDLTLAAGGSLSDATNDYRNLTITESRKDGVDEVRGTLETFETGHLPGHTFALTSATHGYVAEQFTIREVAVSWVRDDTAIFKVSFGDELVTLASWAQSEDAGILPITETKITDLAVSTPKLAAGAVTADRLAAELILVSLLKTSASGNRLELDEHGMRAYDDSDNILVNIPTNGDPVFVSGELLASTLTVTGAAEMRGTTTIPEQAALEVGAGFIAPTVSPSLSMSWDSTLFTDPALDGYTWNGGYFDTNGGTAGTTDCYVALLTKPGSTAYVYEWKLSDGTIDRITALEKPTSLFAEGNISKGFLTRIGADWFVCGRVSGVRSFSSDSTYLLKFVRATGAYTTSADVSARFWFQSEYGWPIKNDGTDLWVLGPSAANALRMVRFDTALAYEATVEITEPAIPSPHTTLSVFPWQFEVTGGLAYVGFVWQGGGASDTKRIYEANLTTGALTANSEWTQHGGADRGGLFHDGTNFRGVGGNVDEAPRIYTYTNWTWTTESPIYWVAYSWYDSAGTTHETDVGPRASITMSRRARLTATMPALPGTGGADHPNSFRSYMNRGAADPGATFLRLQATSTARTVNLSTFNAAGAPDGGGTAFEVATPGYMTNVVSTEGDWFFGGDGTWSMSSPNASFESVGVLYADTAEVGTSLRVTGLWKGGGTTFPAGPANGDRYFRTDDDMWFTYDGTRWKCTCLHMLPFALTTTTTLPVSATATGRWHLQLPLTVGLNTLIEGTEVSFLIASGGSALSGSHKWDITTFTEPTGTAVASMTINSGASNTWRQVAEGTDALIDTTASQVALGLTATKTGTPGNLTFVANIVFRYYY